MTDALALVRGAVQLACFGSQLDGQMALIRRSSYRYKSGAMQDPLFVFLLDDCRNFLRWLVAATAGANCESNEGDNVLMG